MNTKICTKCKIEKEVSQFSKHNHNADGLRLYCKSCANSLKKLYDKNNIEKNKEYRVKNKIHKKAIDKRYYEINKEILKQRAREYYRINKDIVLTKQNKYYHKNKDRIIKYYNIKYKNNVNYNIIQKLRNRINKALKRNSKFGFTLELLGCSINQLKQHLESQFKEGMSWSNYGNGYLGNGMKQWHIDHKIPCDAFDLSKITEQQKCFHYTNLQPLWAKENWEKGSKQLTG